MMTGTTGLGPMYPTIPHIRSSVDGGGEIGELVGMGLLGDGSGCGVLPMGGIRLGFE